MDAPDDVDGHQQQQGDGNEKDAMYRQRLALADDFLFLPIDFLQLLHVGLLFLLAYGVCQQPYTVTHRQRLYRASRLLQGVVLVIEQGFDIEVADGFAI